MSRRIPSYLKHSSGNARVILSGRAVYLGRYGTPESRREYDRVIGEWLITGRAPKTAPAEAPRRITVAEVCGAFSDHAVSYYGDHRDSHAHRIRVVMDDVADLYGDLLAVQFGPLKLNVVLRRWIDQGLCRKTINGKISEVKRAFRWAVSCELVPSSVYHALSAVSGLRKGRTKARDSRKVRPVADSVISETLKHLPGVLQAMVRIQRLTGARPGEVCRMRPMDIDRSGEVWLYTPSRHKTEHHDIERVIALGPKAQDELRPYLLRHEAVPCFSPLEAIDQWFEAKHARRKTPLSCGNRPTGRRDERIRPFYTSDTYRRAIHRVCDRFKLERWSPNQLRHTRATEIRAELGYEAARTVLGHNTDITAVYAERNIALAVSAAKLSG